MGEGSHWTQHAKRWQHIGPPLRPCVADLMQVKASLARHLSPKLSTLGALLLGVTPELAELHLPATMQLVAVDQSQAMIDGVWPGDTDCRQAKLGDWHTLDLADGSIGLVLGDGCFSTLDYPTGYRRLASSLSRVVAQAGVFSIRVFCRPARAESVDALFQAMLAGNIGNFHVFKWRLAMALQGDDPARGVGLDSIWRMFQERTDGAQAVVKRLGWPANEVLTIDNYRASSAAYSFSTVAEVVAELGPEFELVEEWHGRYELAERCPLLLFRRR